MERRLTEEQITKTLLTWLGSRGWHVICFDFPQSGTGFVLHPNVELRTTKNKGAIIPDIVAIKDTTVTFFENKDHFVLADFNKVESLRITDDYSESIHRLLCNCTYDNIYYGVGLPLTRISEAKTADYSMKIDFAVFVSIDRSVSVKHEVAPIFSQP